MNTRSVIGLGLLVCAACGPEATESVAPSGEIAFWSSRDGGYEIYVMNADGTDPRNLTNNPTFDSDYDWSPDGTKIAFVSSRDGNFEIYMMNADGSDSRNLTNSPAYDERPGGRRTARRSPFRATASATMRST